MSKIDLTEDEYTSIAYDAPKELNEKEIISMVEAFVNSKPDRQQMRAKSKFTKIGIQEKSFIKQKSVTKSSGNSNNLEIPMYKVAIQTEGSQDIALVSADERIPAILAYYTEADKNISDENKNCNELLIQMSQELALARINNINQIKDSLRDITLAKIYQEHKISSFDDIKDRINIITDNKTRARIDQDPATTLNGKILGEYGPWCNVRWSASMPYNRSFPQTCPNNWLWDNRPAVSGIVVTVAQALTFVKPNIETNGIKVNWAYLTENMEIHETTDYFGSYVADPINKRIMIGNLMKYISDQCQIQIRCDGTSYYMNNVIRFLNQHGIQIDGGRGLVMNDLINSILALKPVIMYGKTSSEGGHAWLVDGLVDVKTNNSISRYIHANMGMGTSYTGYYLATSSNMSFDANFANFNKELTMYINMRR